MEKSYIEKADRIIRHRIEEELARGREKFILYPFGEMGQYIKNVLNNDFHVQESFCLDNKVRGKGIFPLDFLNSYMLSDEYILLTSEKDEIYVEIREELKKYVAERKIIDIFEKVDITTEYLKRYIEDDVYTMKRYNTKFYLPFWKTDYIQQTIIKNDCYYEDQYLYYVTKVFLGGINLSGKVILDIGANIGNHSIYFAKECGAGKVISFEPIEETFNILTRNIEINGLENIISPYNFGIGEGHSHASIARYSYFNIGMTILRETTNGNIEIYSIDELGLTEDISFIKVDVEGFEEKVIRGALQLIKRCKPRMMIESEMDNNTLCNIIKLLCPMGYDFKHVVGDNYFFYCE